MIRGKSTSKQCPFGLEIPFACKNAGSSISNMVPVEELDGEEKYSSIKYNNKSLVSAIMIDSSNCAFASEIFEDSGCVNCSFNTKGIPMASGLEGLNSGIDYPHVWSPSTESTFSAEVDSFDYYSDNQNRLIPNSIAKKSYLGLIKNILENKDEAK